MRILVIYCHPVETSYNAALHTEVVQQLRGAGHEVDDCDLYAEGFNPVMTREERLRSEDMGGYYRVAADNRDLNYDKFVVKGEVHTMADDSYTSHNTHRLDVEGTVRKILTTDYVQNALKEMEAEKA